MTPTRASRGFTLIEVLVALVIVALGMGALLAALTSSADSAAFLRDKTFAEWVGLNRIAEVRLKNQQVGAKTEGDVEMAGRRWHWEQEGFQLEIPGLTRIDVRVRLADVAEKDKDSWLTTVSGIVGDKVARPGTINVDWRGQPGNNPPNPNGQQNGSNPSAPKRPQPVTPAPDGSAPTPVPSGAEGQ